MFGQLNRVSPVRHKGVFVARQRYASGSVWTRTSTLPVSVAELASTEDGHFRAKVESVLQEQNCGKENIDM